MSFRQMFHSLAQWYARFVSRQGFAVMTMICIAVIVGSAVWTKQTSFERVEPTPPVLNAASAAELWQQSLAEAATPTPAPTIQPPQWISPLQKIIVLQEFDGARMTQSTVTGVWQLHDAADLAADPGETIHAMADGIVSAVTEDGLSGVSVSISHEDGYVTEYAGMSLLAAVREGDYVESGQTIGFAGSSMLAESDMEAHLHLRVTRDGKAIDPLLLLRNVEP